jgi:chromate reductase, NAD(P)H dehydrogenase (quinone)
MGAPAMQARPLGEADAIHVLALGGSLRAASFSSRLLQELCRLGAPELSIEPLDGLDRLPFFNQDQEGEDDAPDAIRRLRATVLAADALLVVTPEYNRSVPATIKNVVDWCSRPHDQGCLLGKPVAIVTASPGPSGGLLAFHHLRQILHAAGATPVGSKELAIPAVFKCFDERGEFCDDTVRGWLAQLLRELRAGVARPAAGYARVEG